MRDEMKVLLASSSKPTQKNRIYFSSLDGKHYFQPDRLYIYDVFHKEGRVHKLWLCYFFDNIQKFEFLKVHWFGSIEFLTVSQYQHFKFQFEYYKILPRRNPLINPINDQNKPQALITTFFFSSTRCYLECFHFMFKK